MVLAPLVIKGAENVEKKTITYGLIIGAAIFLLVLCRPWARTGGPEQRPPADVPNYTGTIKPVEQGITTAAGATGTAGTIAAEIGAGIGHSAGAAGQISTDLRGAEAAIIDAASEIERQRKIIAECTASVDRCQRILTAVSATGTTQAPSN